MTDIRKTKVPAIPAIGNSEKEKRDALEAIKEAVEVGYGRRGDKLDRFVTLRELQDAGIAGPGSGAGGMTRGSALTGGDLGGQVGVDTPGTINGLPDNTPPDYGVTDYTPPPMPTGVGAKAIAPNKIMVYWDPPNYGNHSYAEVFAYKDPAATPTDTGYYNRFVANVGAGFSFSKVCTGASSGNNPSPLFRGRCEGSIFTVEMASADGVNNSDLGALVNPPQWSFFVRFVSLAKVVGKFGPQPTAPPATAQVSIDPVAVLDNMTQSVVSHPLYASLRSFIGNDPSGLAGLKANGGIIGTYLQSVATDTTISQLWTVKMQQALDPADTSNPPVSGMIAAGFGLGIEYNSADGRGTSLFAVNADKFAIMGSGVPYFKLVSFSVSSATATAVFRVPTNAVPSAIKVGLRMVLKCVPIPDPAFPNDHSHDKLGKLEEIEGSITTVTGVANAGGEFRVTVLLTKYQASYGNASQTAVNWPAPDLSTFTYYITGATNIPFIVDTQNSVVGIRGKLVVDGLVRATQAEFDVLTATSAFISSLRANIINANVVCGQSIIAGDGIPEALVKGGAISDFDLQQVDAWIVRLTKPSPAGNYPFRIYNPKRAGGDLSEDGRYNLMSVFGGRVGGDGSIQEYPHLYFNGDLHLGGNATFNMRRGGAAGFGVLTSDRTASAPNGYAYTFWCGADFDYGTSIDQMDDKGAFWIRPARTGEPRTFPFRAGMNADFFLGKNALALPCMAANSQDGSSVVDASGGPRAGSLVEQATSNDSLQIRGLRNGDPAVTLVMVSGLLYSLASDSTSGDNKRFTFKVSLVAPGIGEVLVQSLKMDDYFPEAWDYNLMGVVNAPPGNYRVKIEVTNLPEGNPEGRRMSIVQGWNAVALQVVANGAFNQAGTTS